MMKADSQKLPVMNGLSPSKEIMRQQTGPLTRKMSKNESFKKQPSEFNSVRLASQER